MRVFKTCAGCDTGGHSASHVWQTVGAVDNWKTAIETYSLNNSGPAYWANMFHPQIIDIARKSNMDLLFHSGNCQGFSKGNGKTKVEASKDIRNCLYTEVIKQYVSVIKPQWFVSENIDRVNTFDQFGEAVGLLHGLGYDVIEWLVNAADFGSAQMRRRSFLVARLGGRVPLCPAPTHKTWVTLEQALEGLTEEESLSQGVCPLSSEWQYYIDQLSEGQNWENLPPADRLDILFRVTVDKNWFRIYSRSDIAKTITQTPVGTCGFDPCHWTGRPLSVVEHMILQGMDWRAWNWGKATLSDKYAMIGNGINGHALKAVAESIAKTHFRK